MDARAVARKKVEKGEPKSRGQCLSHLVAVGNFTFFSKYSKVS